jgi:ABC-type phosphate/phosphonate transport system ATPase subunit
MSIVFKKSTKTDKFQTIPVATDNGEKVYITLDDTKGIKRYESKNDMKIIPYLNIKQHQRSMVYISAPSGSGKSVFSRELIESYRSILGSKREVVLFTKTTDKDPAFKNLDNFIQVGMSTDPRYPELDITHLSNKIVIFDDYETLEPALLKHTMLFIKDLAELSRKKNIQLIIIKHQTMDYAKSKCLIFESDTAVLYGSVNRNSVIKFLKSYGDLTKDEIEEAIKMSSKPFTPLIFHKSAPRYIQSKNIIQMLN